MSRAAQKQQWPVRWGRAVIPMILTAFIASGLWTGLLVDLVVRLFDGNPNEVARGLSAALIVGAAWTAARLIDAIVWQAILPRQSGHASPRLAHTLTTVVS